MSFDYSNYKLEQYQEHLPYNVESWYPIISQFTSKSIFLPVSTLLANAFTNYYHNRFNNRKVFTKDDFYQIKQLEKEMYKVFKDFPKAFVRLSSRSPKDGMTLEDNNIHGKYNNRLNELLKNYPPNNEEDKANLKLLAISEIQAKYLVVTNPKEALNLLLSSERVFTDLLGVTAIEDDKLWRMNIIFREWNDDIKDSLEFRLFIKNEKIKCISQYNHFVVFPEILDKYGPNSDGYNTIKQTLIDAWKIVHKSLIDGNNENNNEQFISHYKQGYILDIGIIENNDTTLSYTIIELNPYKRTTGAGLFHWNEVDDIEGTDGNNIDKIELRFLEKPRENIKMLVDDVILPAFNTKQEPYYNYFENYQTLTQTIKDFIGW